MDDDELYDPTADFFPVQITDAILTDEVWYYTATEQETDPVTGLYIDCDSPRTMDKINGPFLVEMNNQRVPPITFVLARQKTTIDGNFIYEFEAPDNRFALVEPINKTSYTTFGITFWDAQLVTFDATMSGSFGELVYLADIGGTLSGKFYLSQSCGEVPNPPPSGSGLVAGRRIFRPGQSQNLLTLSDSNSMNFSGQIQTLCCADPIGFVPDPVTGAIFLQVLDAAGDLGMRGLVGLGTQFFAGEKIFRDTPQIGLDGGAINFGPNRASPDAFANIGAIGMGVGQTFLQLNTQITVSGVDYPAMFQVHNNPDGSALFTCLGTGQHARFVLTGSRPCQMSIGAAGFDPDPTHRSCYTCDEGVGTSGTDPVGNVFIGGICCNLGTPTVATGTLPDGSTVTGGLISAITTTTFFSGTIG